MRQTYVRLEATEMSGATPLRFTPDEVVEILTEAVNLSNQYVSLSQLEAIADEAGIPRETLYQVIQKRLEQANQKARIAVTRQINRRERWQRWKSRFKKLLWVSLFGTVAYLSFILGYESAPRQYPFTAHSYLTPDYVIEHYIFENLYDAAVRRLAHHQIRGRNVHLYILPPVRSYPGYLSSLWVQAGSESALRLLYKTEGRIVRATLSPSERFVAFVVRNSRDAGIWIMDLRTHEYHSIDTSPWEQHPETGGVIAWLDDKTLLYSTPQGRFKCKINERGVPLLYVPQPE